VVGPRAGRVVAAVLAGFVVLGIVLAAEVEVEPVMLVVWTVLVVVSSVGFIGEGNGIEGKVMFGIVYEGKTSILGNGGIPGNDGMLGKVLGTADDASLMQNTSTRMARSRRSIVKLLSRRVKNNSHCNSYGCVT
jgi:hypothetical protein